MPAFCAAIGSFHAKSATTYFVMVLVTVRVLPFFLTVVLIRSVTLFVSTLGVRSYSDQRYSSMQMSTTRHSSRVSTGRAAGCGYSSAGSGLNRDTSRVRFGRRRTRVGQRGLDDGRLGGGNAREDEGGFAGGWIDRRRIGGRHGRGRDGRLGQLAMGRGHSGHGGHCVVPAARRPARRQRSKSLRRVPPRGSRSALRYSRCRTTRSRRAWQRTTRRW